MILPLIYTMETKIYRDLVELLNDWRCRCKFSTIRLSERAKRVQPGQIWCTGNQNKNYTEIEFFWRMRSVKHCPKADIWKKLLVRPNVLGHHFPETSATSQNQFPKPSVAMKRWIISLSDILNGMQSFLDSGHLLSGSGRDVNSIRMNILKEERSIILWHICAITEYLPIKSSPP
jgi:hypothetical protein